MQNNNDNYGTQFPSWLGSLMGMTGGLGSAAGGLFGLFGNPKSPVSQAQPWWQQIPGKTQEYMTPYMNAGKGALEDLQNQYKDLLSGGTQSKLGESYKESPGYQYKLKSAMEAANRAAAAGGGLGGVGHQISSSDIGESVAAKDYDTYMQNQMNLYNQGLSGEQGLNTMGFDATQNVANAWNTYLNNMGQGAYANQAGKNLGKQQSLSNIFGGLGTAGMSALGMPSGGWDALMKLFGGQGQGV